VNALISRRAVAALLAIVLLVAVPPNVALGHAELDTASPADKSTVASSPPQLVFTFTEPLDPKASSLRLVDASGAVVAQGGTVDPTNAKKMTLVVPPQPPGRYTVRWTTKSALDGDIDRGTTTFTIAAPSPSPSEIPSAQPSPSASAAAASPSASVAVPSPSPSGGTGTTTSTSDAVIPVIAALIVLAALGLWLLRGRSRRVG